MKKTTKRIGPAFTLGGLLAASPAFSDIILDPDGTGANRVYSTSTAPSFDSSQLSIGYSGADGALEINAEANVNGETSMTRSAAIIGSDGDSGLLRVVGDGTSGSAQLNINSGVGLRSGNGGQGTLEVLNGGVIHSAEDVYLGTQGLSSTPGTSLTEVNGAGSILRTQQTSTGATWERDGGRITVGFDGQSDSTVNISNAGVVEALDGGAGDSGDDGSIWIGTSSDQGSTAAVNVAGTGSKLRASHYIEVGSRSEINTDSQLNVTNGGQVDVGFAPSSNYRGLNIADVEGNASVNVSGSDIGSGARSTLSASEITLGGRGYVRGFTSDGQPVSESKYDWDSLVAGQQIQDTEGNALFDQHGDPLLAYDIEVTPSFTYTTSDPVYTKRTGNLVVEDGGAVIASGDIHVSERTVHPDTSAALAPLTAGQVSTLTVRDGGEVTASNVYVNEHGRLDGDAGFINANVIVDGGTVAPGNSPGSMYVFGDFTLNEGSLDLEVDPLGLSDFLYVSGDALFGSDAIINVIFSDVFDGTLVFADLVDVDGELSFDQGFSAPNNFVFDFVGTVPADPMFNLQFGDELYEYSNGGLALADPDPSAVPVPSSFALLALGVLSLVLRSPAGRQQRAA